MLSLKGANLSKSILTRRQASFKWERPNISVSSKINLQKRVRFFSTTVKDSSFGGKHLGPQNNISVADPNSMNLPKQPTPTLTKSNQSANENQGDGDKVQNDGNKRSILFQLLGVSLATAVGTALYLYNDEKERKRYFFAKTPEFTYHCLHPKNQGHSFY